MRDKHINIQRVIAILFGCLVCVSFILSAASKTPPPITPPTQAFLDQTSQNSAIHFDEERAFKELTELVKRGQRYYGAPMRDEAVNWLVDQFKKMDAKVSLQSLQKIEPKSQVSFKLTNIIGRLHPERSSRVILGSHWDTRLWAEEDQAVGQRQRPITGANDGSSGVAVLLEVARQLEQLNLTHIGVDIVFFDGEEFGRPGSNDYCAGSRYFAKELKQYFKTELPIGVIVIDMVGDKNLSFPPEKSSVHHARSLTRLVWSEGVRLKLPAFINGLGGGPVKPKSLWIVDDHSPFQKLGIPSTLIIDLDYAHWHTHQDTMDKISAQSLKQTGLALLATLKKMDEAESTK
jgi:glutaminyl-peptide cyclotransferase